MRLSRYFLPVLKENPSEAQIVSHRLMLRAGMIKQQAAGIYSWLPLGLKVLRRIEQQTPISELWKDRMARGLISRLLRLGLLKERRSRVARLTVTVTHEVRGVALVDDLIMRRWKEDLVRHPQLLALRDDAGNTYRYPLRSGPNLGTHLLLPPDLIMQTRLRAGESVLVKPI